MRKVFGVHEMNSFCDLEDNTLHVPLRQGLFDVHSEVPKREILHCNVKQGLVLVPAMQFDKVRLILDVNVSKVTHLGAVR